MGAAHSVVALPSALAPPVANPLISADALPKTVAVHPAWAATIERRRQSAAAQAALDLSLHSGPNSKEAAMIYGLLSVLDQRSRDAGDGIMLDVFQEVRRLTKDPAVRCAASNMVDHLWMQLAREAQGRRDAKRGAKGRRGKGAKR